MNVILAWLTTRVAACCWQDSWRRALPDSSLRSQSNQT